TASAVVTLLNVNLHLGALCALYADDPAYTGFLVLAFLPFLMIPPRKAWLRWSLVLLASGAFVGYQYYYRVARGSGVFGPPEWVGSADYFIPPYSLIVMFL